MVEISFLAEPDRAAWEELARGKDAYFGVERSGGDYERTWRRLLGDEPVRGIAARLDGTMVGIAHYLFHASVWYAGKCYLADLFVAEQARRQGIATAVIERVCREPLHDSGWPAMPRSTPTRAFTGTPGKMPRPAHSTTR